MVTETADVDLAWHGNPARYPSISSPNSLPVTCVMSSKISPASARPSWILAWRTTLQKGHFSTLVSLKHWITINQLNQKLWVPHVALDFDKPCAIMLYRKHSRNIGRWDDLVHVLSLQSCLQNISELGPALAASQFKSHHPWKQWRHFVLGSLLRTANFPLGLVPQKRPPQVPKSLIKCRENSVFWGLVGAFFGEPTQVEICHREICI